MIKENRLPPETTKLRELTRQVRALVQHHHMPYTPQLHIGQSGVIILKLMGAGNTHAVLTVEAQKFVDSYPPLPAPPANGAAK